MRLLLQLEEDFVKANPDWVKELQIMVTTKVKAEIQVRRQCAACMSQEWWTEVCAMMFTLLCHPYQAVDRRLHVQLR
jgi:hypothetical protein